MTDSVPTSLVGMPGDVMRKILEKCDFVAIQCLRKTCHTIRNYIDNTKPKQSFNVIEISGNHQEMSLVFFEKDAWQLYPTGPKISVTYQKTDGENSKITWYRSDRNREKIMRNSNFMDVFCRDFGSILRCKLPILDQISTKIQISLYCTENRLEKIRNTLKSSENTPIKVHTLILADVRHPKQAMGILPYTCPNTLKHLTIKYPVGRNSSFDGMTRDISKILELEHWKKVEELDMWNITVPPGIQNYDHFEIGKVRFKEVTMEHVMKVKENFLNSSSTSKHLQLFFLDFSEQKRLMESFGQPYQNIKNFLIAQQKSWFFRRSDNHVLFIDFSPNLFAFNIKTLEDVPQGARVIG